MAFEVGQHVTWMHVPRGGYGYVWPVDAEILQIEAQIGKAVIAVKKRDGTRTTRIVKLEKLKAKS